MTATEKSDISLDPVLAALKASLADSLGSHLREVWLFGSRAVRGYVKVNWDLDLNQVF
ncbi:MAG: hypothetical protein WCQ50_12760 [Spirochaetota bacterium]